MESIIRDKAVEYMESNSFLSECQYGFIAKRSWTTNLLAVLDRWTESLDRRTPVDVVYLDLSKAFDSVPHHSLLLKLKSYGTGSSLLAWIKDVLLGRRQRVGVNGTYSGWPPVTSGVPQGSVLGPVLFVIFINDLPNIVNSLCQMYADDTKVFVKVEKESIAKLQQDLDMLVEWADCWQLRFNADKCKVLHLGQNNPKQTYSMKQHCAGERVTLGTSEGEKDLGIPMDSELKFSKHVEEQVNKANRILGLIRRSYEQLDKESMNLLFTALVRPHLEFGNVCFTKITLN